MAYEMCTDRGDIDLLTLRDLLARGLADWDDTDTELWTGEYQVFQAADGEYEAADGPILCPGDIQGVPTNRGAWNYTDCNRIRAMMLDIYNRAVELGYKPVWPYTMIGEQTQASEVGSYELNYRFLKNLIYIRDYFGLSSTLPGSINNMKLTTANALEQCIVDIDAFLIAVKSGAEERICGDLFTGEEW